VAEQRWLVSGVVLRLRSGTARNSYNTMVGCLGALSEWIPALAGTWFIFDKPVFM